GRRAGARRPRRRAVRAASRRARHGLTGRIRTPRACAAGCRRPGAADVGGSRQDDRVITTLAVAGYRSLVDLVMPLGRTTVVTGGNGSGKSSLYRSLRRLAAASRGETIGALAAEGGLASALWAGPEVPGSETGTVRKGPVSLRLGFASDELGYLVDL